MPCLRSRRCTVRLPAAGSRPDHRAPMAFGDRPVSRGARHVGRFDPGHRPAGVPARSRRVTCDDGDVCTDDTCDAVAGCRNAPISCDDGVPCTTDVCNPFTRLRAHLPGVRRREPVHRRHVRRGELPAREQRAALRRRQRVHADRRLLGRRLLAARTPWSATTPIAARPTLAIPRSAASRRPPTSTPRAFRPVAWTAATSSSWPGRGTAVREIRATPRRPISIATASASISATSTASWTPSGAPAP